MNTALPPTIPSASRCYELGKALGELVAGWHGCERIAIVASGGLSHYVVLREFDEMVLEAMRGEDFGSIREIPARFFRSGTAETLNWIVVFGVAEGLPMSLIDYVPGYRSRAGTGTGMAFALWDPGDRERRTQAGAGRDAFPMSKTTGDAAGHEFI